MKIGHILLVTDADEAVRRVTTLIEALDRLAVEQHVLVGSQSLARRLHSCPYVTVGPVVRTPVMAYCLMPRVDLVHIHDEKSGQAGLLLTLTRSTPFVMTAPGAEAASSANPLRRSVLNRAQSLIPLSRHEPDDLLQIYQEAIDAWSKLPQDADCR